MHYLYGFIEKRFGFNCCRLTVLIFFSLSILLTGCGKDFNEIPEQNAKKLSITSSAAVTFFENEIAGITIEATSSREVNLFYRVSGGVDSEKFTINSSLGVLKFISPPDYETPTDIAGNAGNNNTAIAADNVYHVEISVADDNNSVSQLITVTVANVIEKAGIPQSVVVNNSAGGLKLKLNWAAVIDATAYKVYWNTSGSVSASDEFFEVSGTTTELVHENLSIGTRYYYRVEANGNEAVSDLSAEVSSDAVMSHWSWVNPLPQGEILNDISYGGGQWVAVGETGAIITSSNGVDWVVRESGTDKILLAVGYGGARWVAVGDNVVLTSLDGVLWEERDSSITSYVLFTDVLYASGFWMVVGRAGKIVTSTNGLDWFDQSIQSTQQLMSVIHDGSEWVAVGFNGLILSSNTTSPTGISWQSRPSNSTELLRSIGYNGSMWVAVGNNGTILTSLDKQTWLPQVSGTPRVISDILHDGNQWIAINVTGFVFTSLDGITWSLAPSTLSTSGNLNAVAQDGNRRIAVGAGGQIFSSTDALSVNWSYIGSKAKERAIYDISYNGKAWLAVGLGGTILGSVDGANWIDESINTVSAFFSVDYDSNQWVVVGANGLIYTKAGSGAWTLQASNTTMFLQAISYNASAGLWIVVGQNGIILSSPDAASWTILDSGVLVTLYAVNFDGKQWIAAGEQGTIVTSLLSSKATVWTPVNSFTTIRFTGIAYGDGTWLAVGNGVILMSTTGDNWINHPFPTNAPFNAVEYYAGRWLMVGGAAATLLTSLNGIDWEQQITGTRTTLAGIGAGNNQWMIAAGPSAGILRYNLP